MNPKKFTDSCDATDSVQTQESADVSSVDRRAVMMASAWAVPAVALTTSVPLYASSPPPPPPQLVWAEWLFLRDELLPEQNPGENGLILAYGQKADALAGSVTSSGPHKLLLEREESGSGRTSFYHNPGLVFGLRGDLSGLTISANLTVSGTIPHRPPTHPPADVPPIPNPSPGSGSVVSQSPSLFNAPGWGLPVNYQSGDAIFSILAFRTTFFARLGESFWRSVDPFTLKAEIAVNIFVDGELDQDLSFVAELNLQFP